MSKVLTVAHIIPELDINIMGGVGRFLQNLVRCLPRNAVKTIILSYKAQESDKQFFQDLGVTVFSRLTHNQEEEGNSLEVTQWMINTLKQIKPDIVQTNAFWGDTLGRLAAQKAGVPVIVVRENNVNLGEIGRQKKMKHRLAKITDAVVCVSEAVKQYAHKVENIPHHRLQVIHNGVMLNQYYFDGNLPSPSPWEFVFVGRLEPQKDPLLLIDGFAELIHKYPHCRLSIIGDGSLREECVTQVAKLGISQSVSFLGYKPKPWDWVKSSSVLIMTSCHEGLPNTVLEAMALGVISIVPNLPVMSEIARADLEAIFYELGDRGQLVTAIESVLEMTVEQRIQISRAARSRVEKDFDAQQMADKYLSLYQKLYANQVLTV
ncbi:glycosyltransferase [Xenococcus sp. PCC 7305]|uniref:glycosyltransferase family 4 protein n=1 Tax=Xenococcus sp. PCC 7305 TaxID=102125 RepID=UPI0002AC2C43|nr:glycosyltransferase family 4 protein [Xenococcus sp. PCC 7305]ELS03906.1 glycosyltransferase [Xenococcus sp. PCC 7305]